MFTDRKKTHTKMFIASNSNIIRIIALLLLQCFFVTQAGWAVPDFKAAKLDYNLKIVREIESAVSKGKVSKGWSKGFKNTGTSMGSLTFAEARAQEYISEAFVKGRAFAISGHNSQNIREMIADYERKSGQQLGNNDREALFRRLISVRRFINRAIRKNITNRKARRRLQKNTRIVVILDEEGKPLLYDEGIAGTDTHKYLAAIGGTFAYRGSESLKAGARSIYLSLQQIEGLRGLGREGREVLSIKLMHQDEDLLRGSHALEPFAVTAKVSNAIEKINRTYGVRQLAKPIREAKDFIGDGKRLSRRNYKAYLAQVSSVFHSLTDLSTTDAELRQVYKEQIKLAFSGISSKTDFTREKHKQLQDALIELSRNKTGDRRFLESLAAAEELIDIALVLSLVAGVGQGDDIWQQLNNFFSSTIEYSIEPVRTKLQASADFCVEYNESTLGRRRSDAADELFLRTHTWLNGYLFDLIQKRAGISEEQLRKICVIGNECASPDMQFGLEYFRLFEIARLRLYEYPLPERIEGNFDPQSPEFANRPNIGFIYRWGHTQMAFVSGAKERDTANVMAIPDGHNNIEIVRDPYSGEMIAQTHAALFYDQDGKFTLARFKRPVRLDVAIVPPRHSLLPRLQKTGIPLSWSDTMYSLCNNKRLYSEIFTAEACEGAFYYPAQISFDGIPLDKLKGGRKRRAGYEQREKTAMQGQIKEFLSQVVLPGVSSAKIIIKPAGGSGGRGITTHVINLEKPELSGLVEAAYQGRKAGGIILQQFARAPPLEEVVTPEFYKKAQEELRKKRQRERKPFDETATLQFSLRTIATRSGDGVTVNTRVILVNDSDLVSMTQGAVMFLLDERELGADKMLIGIGAKMDEASHAVMNRVNEFAKQRYHDDKAVQPLDGGSYLNTDNLLLDWTWDGDRLILAHIEFNIGLGSFWYHSKLLAEAGMNPHAGIDPFLDLEEERGREYIKALEARAATRYAYDAARARSIIAEYGEANLGTRQAQGELYDVISRIDMKREDEIVAGRALKARKAGRTTVALIGGLGFAGTGLFTLFGDAKQIVGLEEVRQAALLLYSLEGLPGEMDNQINKIRWLLDQKKVKFAKLCAELKKLEDMAAKYLQDSLTSVKKGVQDLKGDSPAIRAVMQASVQAVTNVLVVANDIRQAAKGAPSENLVSAFPIQRVSRTSGDKIIKVNEGLFPFEGEKDGLDEVLDRAHKAGTVWASPSRESIAYADLVMSTLRLDIIGLPAQIRDVRQAVNNAAELLGRNTSGLTAGGSQALQDAMSKLDSEVRREKDDIEGLILSPEDRKMLASHVNRLKEAVGHQGISQGQRLADVRNELEQLQWSVERIVERAEGIFGPTFPEIEDELKAMAPYFGRNIEMRKKDGREKPALAIVTTQAPGVCMHILKMVLEDALSEAGYNYKVGKDFYFAFKPSRVTPGRNWQRSINKMPHIVGGVTQEDSRVIRRYLEAIVMDDIHEYGSPEAAELHKPYENAFRDLNIAAANILALFADFLGTADAWETREQIDKRPTHHPLLPGFVAGYCLYKDPWFLEWASRYLKKLKGSGRADEATARDIATLETIIQFTQVFREQRNVNRFMAYYASSLVMHGLEKAGVNKHDSRVVLSGIRYLDEPITDTRNCGTEDIVAGLIGWRDKLDKLPGWAQDAYEKSFAKTGYLTAKNIRLFDPFVPNWGELETHARKDGGEWAKLDERYQEEALFVTVDESKIQNPEDKARIIAEAARQNAWKAVEGQDALVFVMYGDVEHQELISDLPKLYSTMRHKVIVDLRNVMDRQKIQEWLALGGTYVGMGKGELLVDVQLRGDMAFRTTAASALLEALKMPATTDAAQEILDGLSDGTEFENIPLRELTFERWCSLGGNFYLLDADEDEIKAMFEGCIARLTSEDPLAQVSFGEGVEGRHDDTNAVIQEAPRRTLWRQAERGEDATDEEYERMLAFRDEYLPSLTQDGNIPFSFTESGDVFVDIPDVGKLNLTKTFNTAAFDVSDVPAFINEGPDCWQFGHIGRGPEGNQTYDYVHLAGGMVEDIMARRDDDQLGIFLLHDLIHLAAERAMPQEASQKEFHERVHAFLTEEIEGRLPEGRRLHLTTRKLTHRPLGEAVDIMPDKVTDGQSLSSRITKDTPVLVSIMAGMGRRFGQDPKCIQPVCGRPVAVYSVDAAKALGWNAIGVVGYAKDRVMRALGPDVIYVDSDDPTGGTGFATLEASSVKQLEEEDPLIVLCMGDKPGITERVLREITQQHNENGADLTFMSAEYTEGRHKGKGRIIEDEDGNIIKIMEQREIDNMKSNDTIDSDSGYTKSKLDRTTKGNCPLYICRASVLFGYLRQLDNSDERRHNEYFVTDIVAMMLQDGKKVETFTVTPEHPDYDLLVLDVTRPKDLDRVETVLAAKSVGGDLHKGRRALEISP